MIGGKATLCHIDFMNITSYRLQTAMIADEKFVTSNGLSALISAIQ